jgi:tRNA threonylcarbamoyladenosine biosynthesis protein TsaB
MSCVLTPAPTLVLDTSTSRCTVLLAAQTQIYWLDLEAERSHKERLLPMVQAVCAAADLIPTECELLGCVVGPGSFTGVRIGVAATQALALAAGCTVARLDALRLQALSTPQPERPVVSWRHSRGELYYAAWFAAGTAAAPAIAQSAAGDGHTVLLDGAAGYLDWLALDDPNSAGHCGDVPPWLPADCLSRVLPETDASERCRHLLAQTIAGAEAGLAVSPEAALPIYLPEDSPWRPA